MAGRHGVPSRAASAQSSAPHAERGRVHVGRAAVVDGEVGRAVNRPGGRAVPGLGSLLVSGFLEEGKAVRCGSQSRGLGGGTLLSCSPLLQGIRVKGDEDDAFQTSVDRTTEVTSC